MPDRQDTGADYKLPPGLAPLERHRADFTIVQGLANNFANEAHWGSTFWLTGANRYAEPGQSFHHTVSVDQVIAALFGKTTRFAAVQLSCGDGIANGHGPGLSLAWDSRGKPVAGWNTPLAAYHRMFSDETMPLARRRALLAQKRSVLDAVLTDVKRIRRGLNKADLDKVDEYFQGVRDVETRLAKDEQWMAVPKSTVFPCVCGPKTRNGYVTPASIRIRRSRDKKLSPWLSTRTLVRFPRNCSCRSRRVDDGRQR